MWVHTQKEAVPKKRYFVVIEKYIEDARQHEKHVPDVLEAIMRPKLFVKDEIRTILSKMHQFGSKIKKNKGPTF